MAVRQLTYTFETLEAFLTAYEEQLSKGSFYIEPGKIDGELAKVIKMDLVVPIIGRKGPIEAQVIHRSPDGGAGLQLPNIPQDVTNSFRSLFEFIAEVRDYLVSSGQYVARAEVDQLTKALKVEKARKPPVAAAAAAVSTAPAQRSTRGLLLPDTGKMSPALAGSMTDRSLRDAFTELAIEHVTGLLVIKEDKETTRYGFWDKGGPVGWRTDPLNEAEVLGMLLYKAEQVTKEQVQESLKLMKKNGSRQGEALVQMGVMTYPQLIMVLGKQNEHILKQVMKTRTGAWEFYLLPALPERYLTTPLKVPSMLYRALYSRAREMKSSDLQAQFKASLNMYVAMEEGAQALLPEIKFLKKERDFIEVIGASSWRLRELFSVSPLSRAMTSAVLWALEEMGMLIMKETEDLERYKARVSARIARKKGQLQGTHFDILELHWVCVTNEVEEHYNRLRQEFEAERFHDLTDQQTEALGEIQTKLATAFEVLKVDRSRRQYRKDVIEADLIIGSADLLGKKGEMAIMRQDRREACNCFSKAAELIPGNTTYQEGLRRATVL